MEIYLLANSSCNSSTGFNMFDTIMSDTIKDDLLIAKLYAYGFSEESLKILHSYLSNRWHRTKIKQFSSWQELAWICSWSSSI